MKKNLITGASGFVGVNLIQYFKKKSLFCLPINLRNGLPNTIPEDINAVIHLAGKAHDLKNIEDPYDYFRVNTELTKKIFDLFLLSKAEIFIFLSSVKASADTVEGILTEHNPANPVTVYGQSKLKAEQYLLSQLLPEGKRLFILRPCMIHGPGNKGNLNLLFQFVKKGIPYPLGAFENNRSFLSIENLCFVIKELIERDDIPSGIYNIADEQPLSTKDVLQIMGEIICKRPVYLHLNKRLVKKIAELGDYIPIILNSERLKKLTENFIVNTDKLQKAINKPLPIDSSEGLKNSLKSFLDNKKNYTN